MLAGTRILWDGYWSYYELIRIREDSGVKSFNQEYQNNPTDEERQIFKPEHFTWFDDEDISKIDTRKFGAVDVAMGKEKRAYSVIVSGAVNVDTGTLYVYDACMERGHRDVLIDKVVEYTMREEYDGVGVEAQAMQEFIADRMRDRLQNVGYPAYTRLKKIKQHAGARKSMRIEALLPDIQSGKIRFHRKFQNSPEMEQFEMYGMHNHDDFPDAVAMLNLTASEKQAKVSTVKRMNRW